MKSKVVFIGIIAFVVGMLIGVVLTQPAPPLKNSLNTQTMINELNLFCTSTNSFNPYWSGDVRYGTDESGQQFVQVGCTDRIEYFSQTGAVRSYKFLFDKSF